MFSVVPSTVFCIQLASMTGEVELGLETLEDSYNLEDAGIPSLYLGQVVTA